MDTSSGSRSGSAEQSDGALFDLYYASVLGGEVESPETFFARNPSAGRELRERIWTAFRSLQRSGPGRTGTGEGLPFERLGDFRLLRRLGEGGMGAVYEARQESLGRTVALKIVRADVRSSPSARARFEREAAIAARLSHPNVVTVHAFGEDQGVGYLAMEYLPGRGLDEALRAACDAGEVLPAADVIRWGAEIARALVCVHATGVVHRDVKPSNIRVTPEGRAVLLDFGVARDEELDRLSLTGPLVGSPLYAAPEQLSGGREIDQRTDVYGLGATLYECLAGRPVVERGTVEQVIQRKLLTDPVPLRRLRERIARDLHVVVMKALEREPARRYATAEALATDLDAVLAFQPIRARPPGPIRRVTSWARRRPAVAAATVSLMLSAVVAVSVAAVAERSRADEQREGARALVAEAEEEVRKLGVTRVETRTIENEVREFLADLTSKHLPLDHVERLEVREVEALRLRRDRQESVHTVLEMLRRAERLDAHVPGVDAVRASLYLERYFGAHTWEDHDAARFFHQRVVETDPGGDAAQRLVATGRVSIVTHPPGASVHGFRYVALRELEGRTSPRQAPVPVHADDGPHVGRMGLRVVSGPAGFPSEALIIEVDGESVAADNHRRLREAVERGGVRVHIVDANGGRTADVPTGVSVRATAAPLLPGASSDLGTSPLRLVDMGPGAYVFLVRSPGHEDVRVFVQLSSGGDNPLEFSLLPEGTTPAGYVRVVRRSVGNNAIEVFMMEREVTCAEYLTFLNDPRTLARLGTEGVPTLVPRGLTHETGTWERGEDGRFALPETWRPDWPVIGVSYDDALAYARWMTTHRPPPRGTEYALPDHETWLAAGGAATFRQYVFGDAFRPRWCSSCFSREDASLESVLEYPVDESPCGAFDMTGSAMEWCEDWWDESRGLRRLLGGSWAQAKPDVFRLHGGHGLSPAKGNDESGFRLVLRRTDGFR